MNTKVVAQIFREELYQVPKRVIILIPVAWDSLEENQITQLNKILDYVKLSPDAVQMLTYSEVEISTLKIFSPSVILSFGTSLTPQLTPYESHQINDFQIIYSEALGKFGDTEKRSLMVALKHAFRI